MFIVPVSGLEAQAACADVVQVRGVPYVGTYVRKRLVGLGRVAAVRPACNDTPNANGKAERIALRRLRAVPPGLALQSATNRHVVYVAAGTFPQSPRHPLHGALYASPRQPNECRKPVRPGAVTVRGRLAETPYAFGTLAVATAHGRKLIFVDARTSYSFALTRRLRKGDRVAIDAARCRALVARRIQLEQ